MTLADQGFRVFKDFKHKEMYSKYRGAKVNSPFTLFHSRMPSAGAVNKGNIQPFISSKLAFCHNGTQPSRDLAYLCLSQGIEFHEDDSDTLLLFKLLSRAKLNSSLAMLKKVENNFVLASMETRRVYIIGDFKFDSEKGRIQSAWNAYCTDRIYIETDFAGKILYFHTFSKYVKPNNYFNREPHGQSYIEYDCDIKYKNGEAVSVWDPDKKSYVPLDEINKEEETPEVVTDRDLSGVIDDSRDRPACD